MAKRSFRLSLAIAILATACDCGEDPPPDDTFDGNVIVGDGSLPDAGGADAEADAGEGDAGEDSGTDGGSDAADTGALDAGDRCTEPAEAVLTATAAIAELGTWEGMIVEITGTATRTALDCTELACPMQMPCCNTCTATITIEGLVPLFGGSCFSPPPGCAGSECAQTCQPALLGVPQRFRGTLLDRGAQGVGLELFSVSN